MTAQERQAELARERTFQEPRRTTLVAPEFFRSLTLPQLLEYRFEAGLGGLVVFPRDDDPFRSGQLASRYLTPEQTAAYQRNLLGAFFAELGADPLERDELARAFGGRAGSEAPGATGAAVSDLRMAEIWDRLERPGREDLDRLHAWAGGDSYEDDLRLLGRYGADLPRLGKARRALDLEDAPAVLAAYLERAEPGGGGGAARRGGPEGLDAEVAERSETPGFRLGNEVLLEVQSALLRFGGATLRAVQEVALRKEEELWRLGREHLPFVRCPSCGKVIGPQSVLFQGLEIFYRASLEARGDVEARDIRHLWRALGLTRYCCMQRAASLPLLAHKSEETWVPAGFHSLAYPPTGEEARLPRREVSANLSVVTERQIASIVPDFRIGTFEDVPEGGSGDVEMGAAGQTAAEFPPEEEMTEAAEAAEHSRTFEERGPLPSASRRIELWSLPGGPAASARRAAAPPLAARPVVRLPEQLRGAAVATARPLPTGPQPQPASSAARPGLQPQPARPAGK